MEEHVKFNFSKNYVLENDFAKLIPLSEEHIFPLAQISKDPEIWKYFLEKGDTINRLTAYIQRAIKNRNLGSEYPFVVYDKQNEKFAGVTRLYEYSDSLKTIKLGHTWYGKQFRGSGLNKHCKYLLLDFTFEKLKVERIGFGSYIDNIVSVAAMKSIGCKKEGIMRNMFPSIDGNGRTDAILLSILKDEWFTIVKSELTNKINA